MKKMIINNKRKFNENHTNLTRWLWLTISNSGKVWHIFSIVVVLLKPTLYKNSILQEMNIYIYIFMIYIRAISSIGPWPQTNTCLSW